MTDTSLGAPEEPNARYTPPLDASGPLSSASSGLDVDIQLQKLRALEDEIDGMMGVDPKKNPEQSEGRQTLYRRVFLSAVGTLMVLGIIICIIIGVSDARSVYSVFRGQNLKDVPYPPSDITTICDFHSIETKAGRKKCERICNVAGCCAFRLADYRSCSELVDVCVAYESPCSNLAIITVTIPSPTSNLDESCSLDSLGTTEGFETCRNDCEMARCCVEPGEKCKILNPEMCDSYKACTELYELFY